MIVNSIDNRMCIMIQCTISLMDINCVNCVHLVEPQILREKKKWRKKERLVTKVVDVFNSLLWVQDIIIIHQQRHTNNEIKKEKKEFLFFVERNKP